ncbi:MAG: GtrA family protein, partial [Negativicutes bacterium]
ITSNLIAYYLNSTFIFPEPLSVNRCLRFALSYVPNYIIQNLIVLLFYNLLGYPPLLSYLLAAILGVPATFLCVKLFAFGRT